MLVSINGDTEFDALCEAEEKMSARMKAGMHYEPDHLDKPSAVYAPRVPCGGLKSGFIAIEEAKHGAPMVEGFQHDGLRYTDVIFYAIRQKSTGNFLPYHFG